MTRNEVMNRVARLWHFRYNSDVRSLLRLYFNEGRTDYCVSNLPILIGSSWDIRGDYVANPGLTFLAWAMMAEITLANGDELTF